MVSRRAGTQIFDVLAFFLCYNIGKKYCMRKGARCMGQDTSYLNSLKYLKNYMEAIPMNIFFKDKECKGDRDCM